MDSDVKALRDALDDQELRYLEAQRAHFTALQSLRTQLRERDLTVEQQQIEISRLRTDASRNESRELRHALQSDDRAEALATENERLQLQLQMAQESYDELAAATRSHEAARALEELRRAVAERDAAIQELQAGVAEREVQISTRDRALTDTNVALAGAARAADELRAQLDAMRALAADLQARNEVGYHDDASFDRCIVRPRCTFRRRKARRM
jgi:chromosome segregation ATPase